MSRETFRNQLLNALDPGDLARLMPLFELVSIGRHMPIESPGTPYEHVYFPEDGVISVVANAAKGKATEIALIGREGMSGIATLLGDDRSANESFVQVRGEAWRIGVGGFRRMLEDSPRTHTYLLRYVQTFLVQTSQTALANAKSSIEARLARWLLMVHDRDGTKRLEITHEFMAIMLGVRRAGVTVSLHSLEGYGLIRSERGRVLLVDRLGLEELAGAFYGLPEAEYRRIMVQ